MHHMHHIREWVLPEWALLLMVGIVLVGALFLHFRYPINHGNYPWDNF